MIKPTRFSIYFFLMAVISGCFFCNVYTIKAFAEQQSNKATELQEKLQKEISLDLRDMDVVDVYKFLGVKGNFNISISKTVSGRVTLYLKSVSITDAMDIISIANSLAYRIMGENIIHVMTESEYSGMFGERFSDKRNVKITYLQYAKPAYVLEALKNIKSEIGRIVIDEDTGTVVLIDTEEKIKEMLGTIKEIDHSLALKVFELKYANAEDVANKLREKLDNKAVGSVQPDARSNQLVIRAFPERMKEVEQIIEALDRRTRAVHIEARILKITLNPSVDRGIDWEGIFRGFKDLNFVGSFAPTITPSSIFGKIAVGDLSTDNFTATLKMLDQVTETKILANPSIMVVDNKEAKIHIGDKLAYVTTTTIGTGESQKVNESIHYVDVGVQFRVTPTINEDGYVTMKIRPEISSQSDTITTTQGAEVPLINTTLVETDVIVKDGHTIVIGGLRQDELTHSEKGVPVLKDIPIIGKAFSNVSDDKTKTEIVILLTPHVVYGDENFVDKNLSHTDTIKPDKDYTVSYSTEAPDMYTKNQDAMPAQLIDKGNKGTIKEKKSGSPEIKPDKKY